MTVDEKFDAFWARVDKGFRYRLVAFFFPSTLARLAFRAGFRVAAEGAGREAASPSGDAVNTTETLLDQIPHMLKLGISIKTPAQVVASQDPEYAQYVLWAVRRRVFAEKDPELQGVYRDFEAALVDLGVAG